MTKLYKATYEDVYKALSFHEWRNPLQVSDWVAREKNISSFDVNLISVYARLMKLHRKGYADRQYRQPTAEESAGRSGRKIVEYKLTEYGLRKRVEIEQQSPEGIEGILVPIKS